MQGDEEAQVKPRFGFLFALALTVTFGSINFGYNVVYYSSCIGILNDQMGWTGNKADLYNAILNGIPYAGFISGTFIAPIIMGKISKRATMIVANMIGMVGISITMIKNFYAFCAGRLVFGVCIGILQIAGPTFLVMSVPPDLMVIFGPFINIIINFGIFLNSLLAYILP